MNLLSLAMRPAFAHAAAGLALSVGALAAHAADFTLSGDLANHNDVVRIALEATDGADVHVWTDSWLSGLNFDPTLALWQQAGSDWQLVTTVDDDDTVGAGQGYYDAGWALPALGAGSYLVTLGASPNAPVGTLLSQGFELDAETPIPVPQWNQPSYDPNANDQKGTFWRLQVSGVQQAAVVPEPSTWLLMVLGAALLVPVARRR